LESINLYRYVDDFSEATWFNLDIVLFKDLGYERDKKLLLRFLKVADFRAEHFISWVWNGVYLEIFDMSTCQLEGVKYKVVEAELDLFSFYCESFEVEILS
jgi:hypothetical protein